MNILVKLIQRFFRKDQTEIDIENNQIIVFGDSHSRAFSLNPNFIPFFIGAGKEHNFINEENAEKVSTKLDQAMEGLDEQTVMFCFGEPDTRHFLGLGWYPWEGKREFEIDNFRPHVDRALERYSSVIKRLKEKYKNEILIFNVTPSIREEQNRIVNYYNSALKEIVSKIDGVTFIEINDKIYTSEDEIIDQQYYSDTVHLNNKIQILVEDFLLSKGLITKKGYDEDVSFSHKKVQSRYKYDKRFGCYVLE